jgi:hypothetical protein
MKVRSFSTSARRPLRLAAGALLAATALASHADIVNGSFETGNFSGWTTSGVTAVIGAGGGGAIDGTRQAYLDTSPSNVGGPAQTSTISQTFEGGGYLHFWWNFLTNEFPDSADFNDNAFVEVDGVSYGWADTFSSFSASTLGGFADMTGYQMGSITLGAWGMHTVTFGVRDGGDGGVDSALLIDRVQAIPEPAALSLVMLGLGATAVTRRRKPRA